MPSRRPKRRNLGMLHWVPIAAAMLIQLGFILLLVFTVSLNSLLISWSISEILSIVLAVYITNRRDNPSYKLVWVTVLLLFPLTGALFYLLWGRRRLPKRGSEHLKAVEEASAGFLTQPEPVVHSLSDCFPEGGKLARCVRSQGGYPVWHNGGTDYYSQGEEFYKALLYEISRAKKFIFLEFFIIAEGDLWDGMHELLLQKVREGVEVRILYDDCGSFATLRRDFPKRLEAEGIRTRRFNKVIPRLSGFYLGWRDHRKIVVVDGDVAFTGGVNIADEYVNLVDVHGHWKDSGIRVKGQAAWSFTVLFLQMWQGCAQSEVLPEEFSRYRPQSAPLEEGFLQPYGDTPLDDENPAREVYLSLIRAAKHTCYLTSPYLIPDDETLSALRTAAQAGVGVRIITPKIGDHAFVHLTTRSFYGDLLEAGVKIYEYTPGFIHSKTMAVDGYAAAVGSVNIDYRSFFLHFECGAWMCGCDAVRAVHADFLDTLTVSEEISLDEWKRRPWFVKAGQALLRIIAPML